jgi:hypothetical protein
MAMNWTSALGHLKVNVLELFVENDLTFSKEHQWQNSSSKDRLSQGWIFLMHIKSLAAGYRSVSTLTRNV